ncbi:SIR2 family protein [Brucella pseudogrignonensis]|uniref:SIR2 family NAD-dependent protein deacylase n=1 Tax=Brucella pseudogrignonensis TaxID=419475 RepID=UPI001EDB29BA|nr:SIR2 family protein [Brucella pseudogrignonensis]UKK94638.1 SIR2 family protein [Brucella pseudogrignonensis]
MQSHDPARQISFIQQALSQNRKPIGFFIGAGCPLSVRVETHKDDEVVNHALIPDVSGLTTIIAERMTNDPALADTWLRLINAVKDDGQDSENIEFLLSRIRQLQGVAGNGKVRDLSAAELTALDEKICSVISEEVNRELPTRNTAYHDLAVWTRSVHRAQPVHLFTTNYDLLLEQALEESSAPYFDGFIGSRRAFFDLGAVEDEGLLPARWTRLWKVHGSLNWRLDKGSVVRTTEKFGGSYLIYPSHLKYDQSRKMPYLAMLDRLKSFLLKPSSVLFICGYSFADDHINDVIMRSLETNATAHVFAFMHGKLGDDRYAKARECALSTPNLSMIGFDSAIVGRISGIWRPEPIEGMVLPQNVFVTDNATAAVQLGDFAVVGSLLRSLAGAQEQTDEA